jgi:hypothetical protein
MAGSIERIWRVLPKRPLMSAVVVLIAGINSHDPSRRATGYGGVIPVPGPSAGAPSSAGRVDPILEQQRRDRRAERGRVLYAAGHAPHDTATTRSVRMNKTSCPEQRVGQGRAGTSAPNS